MSAPWYWMSALRAQQQQHFHKPPPSTRSGLPAPRPAAIRISCPVAQRLFSAAVPRLLFVACRSLLHAAHCRQALIYDHRGVGQSSSVSATRNQTSEQLAADALAVVDAVWGPDACVHVYGCALVVASLHAWLCMVTCALWVRNVKCPSCRPELGPCTHLDACMDCYWLKVGGGGLVESSQVPARA